MRTRRRTTVELRKMEKLWKRKVEWWIAVEDTFRLCRKKRMILMRENKNTEKIGRCR